MITSLQNPTIKRIAKLQTSSRSRREEGCFVVEGPRELGRAWEKRWEVLEVFYCEELLSASGEKLLYEIRSSRIEAFETSAQVFEKIAYRNNPTGILALVKSPELTLEKIKLSPNPIILIAEGLEKPGNIGSLMRIADAAGVDGLIICNPTSDVFNPNVIRTSTGTIFAVPTAVCSSEEAITWLNKHDITPIITSLESSQPYTSTNFGVPCAIVIGSEQAGLSGKWMKVGAQSIIIPMQGIADSLNASVTAGIVVYEALRQRMSS